MEAQETFVGIDDYWQALSKILQRRWVPALGIFVPVFFISLLAFSLKKPLYVAEGKLLLQRTNTISSLTGVGTEIAKLEPLAQDKSNPLNTEAEVILSLPILKKTIDRLNLQDDKGASIKPKNLVKRLSVQGIKETDILRISYKDTDARLASQVVNTLIDIYLEQHVSFHKSQTVFARKFLEKQVSHAELTVRRAEAELREFQEENQIVALKEEGTQALETITNLQRQIANTQSQIANINAQSQAISQQLNMDIQSAIGVTSLSQSPGIQDILKEVQQTESQLAVRRTILQDTHPEIISLQNKLAALKQILQQRSQNVVGVNSGQEYPSNNFQIGQLQQQLTTKMVELESTRQGLYSEFDALTKLQKGYRERLKNLPRLEQQQRELERKAQAAQSTYSLLLQKLQESRIAENQTLGNVRLISAAQVPDEPISSALLSYLSAAVLASIAALATIYLLEVGDISIKSIDEARKLLGLPVLGVIPSFWQTKKSTFNHQETELSGKYLVGMDTPRSLISEAFRMLRVNLNFVSAEKNSKVIVVTSSIPKEGKSTVAANLATAMAQIENKVLLIDADFYRPVQHQIWELSNSQGLSNVIVGQDDVRTATKKVMDNLYVLTSGVLPPNPASLLDSKRMADLIASFAAKYDFVIIDAPSVTVTADALTLGQIADGVLFVVRPGVVDSVNAMFAKELLEKSGQNVLGQIVNGVIPNMERYKTYSPDESGFDVMPTSSPKMLGSTR